MYIGGNKLNDHNENFSKTSKKCSVNNLFPPNPSNYTLFFFNFISRTYLLTFTQVVCKPQNSKLTFLRWPSRVIPNKYFSNLQIHFKPKRLYFKSRSISQISSYILESAKYYFKSITIFQIKIFIFEIEIYFSNL